jgi:hypothetical protein
MLISNTAVLYISGSFTLRSGPGESIYTEYRQKLNPSTEYLPLQKYHGEARSVLAASPVFQYYVYQTYDTRSTFMFI